MNIAATITIEKKLVSSPINPNIVSTYSIYPNFLSCATSVLKYSRAGSNSGSPANVNTALNKLNKKIQRQEGVLTISLNVYLSLLMNSKTVTFFLLKIFQVFYQTIRKFSSVNFMLFIGAFFTITENKRISNSKAIFNYCF